jgi:DNA-binding NarL/FixJ family response regulator
MTLRCLIVDDSHQFLSAARDLLASQGITVVGLASTTAEALRSAAELHPDVTLVDIDLGAESGLDLVRQLHHLGNQGSAVIVISNRAEQDYAELIAASPALGFLSKTAISSGAIHDLLASHQSREGNDVANGPRER